MIEKHAAAPLDGLTGPFAAQQGPCRCACRAECLAEALSAERARIEAEAATRTAPKTKAGQNQRAAAESEELRAINQEAAALNSVHKLGGQETSALPFEHVGQRSGYLGGSVPNPNAGSAQGLFPPPSKYSQMVPPGIVIGEGLGELGYGAWNLQGAREEEARARAKVDDNVKHGIFNREDVEDLQRAINNRGRRACRSTEYSRRRARTANATGFRYGDAKFEGICTSCAFFNGVQSSPLESPPTVVPSRADCGEGTVERPT